MSPDRTGEEIAELKARIEELEQQVDGQQSGSGLSMSRRGVLGSLAGAGIAGAALQSASEPASAQTSAVGQLGSESERVDLYGATVDTEALEAETLQTKTGPVANVRAHGAELDGSTDDSQALTDAFNAVGPSGTVLIPSDGEQIRLGSVVELDLEGESGFSFECKTPIKADGSAIRLVNGFPRYIEIFAENGGSGSLSDNLLELRGARGGRYDLWAKGYSGNVLKFTASNSGEPLTTNQFVNTLYSFDCLRPYYGNDFQGGVGIGKIWGEENQEAGYFKNANDLTILYYENFFKGSADNGMRFEGCDSVHLGKIELGGDLDGFAFRYEGSTDNPDPNNLDIDEFFGAELGSSGALIKDTTNADIKLNCRNFSDSGVVLDNVQRSSIKTHTSGGEGPGLILNGVENCDIEHYSQFDNTGLSFESNQTGRSDINCHIYQSDNNGITDNGESDIVRGDVSISGSIRDCGQTSGTNYELELSGISRAVLLTNLKLESSTSDGLTNLSSSKVRWIMGTAGGSSTTFADSTPSTVEYVDGV